MSTHDSTRQFLIMTILGLITVSIQVFAASDDTNEEACMVVSAPRTSAAPDYAREQRWADEITPSIFIGEPIYLTQKNQHKFLSLLSEQDNTRMGVVIAHGMGLHPDWGMIGTLRQNLVDYGYTTLSIQMPILAADATYEEYPPLFPEAVERLGLAVNHLKQKGYQHVVIISHSNGSRMSRVYMADNPSGVSAWVALSLTRGDTFEGINVPVLDLYGEQDLSHVLSSTLKRKATLKNPTSIQKEILNADHFFNGQENLITLEIKQFLDRVK